MEINLQRNFSIKKEAISREYYIKKNRTFRNKIKINLSENSNSITL